jgi:hypothetical protein
MNQVKLRFADGHEEIISLADPTAEMIVHECADTIPQIESCRVGPKRVE